MGLFLDAPKGVSDGIQSKVGLLSKMDEVRHDVAIIMAALRIALVESAFVAVGTLAHRGGVFAVVHEVGGRFGRRVQRIQMMSTGAP